VPCFTCAQHVQITINPTCQLLKPGDSFVDDRFNGHYWPDELKAHMIAAYNSKDGSTAYREIETMLADLGDPYTRIIPPR
jgi:C-terminal processing protease CtpA/Prc